MLDYIHHDVTERARLSEQSELCPQIFVYPNNTDSYAGLRKTEGYKAEKWREHRLETVNDAFTKKMFIKFSAEGGWGFCHLALAPLSPASARAAY